MGILGMMMETEIVAQAAITLYRRPRKLRLSEIYDGPLPPVNCTCGKFLCYAHQVEIKCPRCETLVKR